MTEREITEQRIIFLKDRQTLFIRETDFKIAMLEVQLRKIAPIPTRDMTGSEIVQKMQRQKPRATNFDYKNEVEAREIAPGTV